MTDGKRTRVHDGWWAAALVCTIVSLLVLSLVLFFDELTPYQRVSLSSDRAGLVMDPGAKVQYRGVQVGKVAGIRNAGGDSVHISLDIDPDKIRYIPATVDGEIRATTIFGAKYVDLVGDGSPGYSSLAAGAVIRSRNVTTEVDTVFESLVGVLDQIDPQKLNGVLSAIAEGVRGRGDAMGQAISDANSVLLAVNPRSESLRRDWTAVKGAADAYSSAAGDIIKVLDAATTTATTITSQQAQLNDLLLNVVGFSSGGTGLLTRAGEDLDTGINALEPTTSLLLKYSPSFTCTFIGGYNLLNDYHLPQVVGGNGSAGIVSAGFSLGDDPYKYPDNLPIVGAKGGPGGKPGCGSLPDVSKNFPVRAVITNTGWGTGLDYRPNPGIGFPGWANYFPVTRAVPAPPSMHNRNGPAPGPPPPFPGGPPYGAPWYAADGTPLYPGLPPGIPSASPPPDAAHPPPGSEPFAPADPGLQPTPVPAAVPQVPGS